MGRVAEEGCEKSLAKKISNILKSFVPIFFNGFGRFIIC